MASTWHLPIFGTFGDGGEQRKTTVVAVVIITINLLSGALTLCCSDQPPRRQVRAMRVFVAPNVGPIIHGNL